MFSDKPKAVSDILGPYPEEGVKRMDDTQEDGDFRQVAESKAGVARNVPRRETAEDKQ